MSVKTVGGDKLVLNVETVTAGANLAGLTLVTVAGAAVSSAAGDVFGVLANDVKSGDSVSVKTHGFLEVIATGTVTAGGKVEVLQGTVYANIDGTKTTTTSAGVQDVAAGYPVGLALTGSDAYGTVIVAFTDSVRGAQKVS